MNRYNLVVRITLPDETEVELKLPLGEEYDAAKVIVDNVKVETILSA